jgi:hypothetical protein
MKNLLILAFSFTNSLGYAQSPKDYSNDVANIDNIIAALYEVISGGPGEPRDWDRFLYLFSADGKLIPTRKGPDGVFTYRYWTPEEYRDMFVSSRSTVGFYELELYRVSEQYGAIAHAFSTYETRAEPNGPATNRGINSIQLMNDGKRWYVVNVFWSAESDGFPLPDHYLGEK